MISPTSLILDSGNSIFIPHQEGLTMEKLERIFSVSDIPKSCVAWNGHEFEVIPFSFYERVGTGPWQGEVAGWDSVLEAYIQVYWPIDPRTNAKDWRGAINAYLNKAKTHWLPEHCDADHMHDREVEIVAVLRSVFTPQIEELDRAWKITPATKPNGWPLGTPFESQAVKFLKWDTLRTFREEAVKCAITEARERHIGWYHQHPHLSHVHNLAHDCITTTLRDAPANKYALVVAEIRNAAVSLAPHPYERRWDREARLKAEAAAKAAAAAENEESGDAASD